MFLEALRRFTIAVENESPIELEWGAQKKRSVLMMQEFMNLKDLESIYDIFDVNAIWFGSICIY